MSFLKTMIFLSILSLCWWRKNIIMLLLSLEFMLISMFTIMSYSTNTSASLYLLIMLTIMVMGSSMGLSMLISISHTHNSSNSMFINILVTFDKNNFTFNHDTKLN